MTMRAFITTLLIASLIAMPARSWVTQVRCGCDTTQPVAAAFDSIDSTDTCCPPSTGQSAEPAENDPDRDPFPCDDQDCPSECCELGMGHAYVPPTMPRLVTPTFELRNAYPIVHAECTSPHLLALKRPPKSA